MKWSDLYDGAVHFCHEQIEHKRPKTWYEYVDYTKNENGVSRFGRAIQIIPELQKIFDNPKKLQDDLGIESEFMFCDIKGNWIIAKSYERALLSICKSLGIDSKGTYIFRKDVNNRMAETGIEIFERALNRGPRDVVTPIKKPETLKFRAFLRGASRI